MTTAVDPIVARALHDANALVDAGDLRRAADTICAVAHLDRAHAVPALQEILVRLTVVEHGVVFRYVPGGSFAMGNDLGEPDERPAHDVVVDGFWLSEAPLSWDDVARVLGWPPPPRLPPREELAAVVGADEVFDHVNDDKIRLQYCENETTRARDWHAHDTVSLWRRGDEIVSAQELFGVPERHAATEYRYDQKPMVAVSWELAQAVAARLSSSTSRVRLPTEAEWERAARGCFRGCDWPWGDAAPDGTRADFDRFARFSILPSRACAPNDFGLFAMAGGVWEWCEDDYDACFYAESPATNPVCRVDAVEAVEAPQHVLRGGSWADAAEALRVSFRFAGAGGSIPNVGFRLARDEVGP